MRRKKLKTTCYIYFSVTNKECQKVLPERALQDQK